MTQQTATVIIPTFNGEAFLREVLTAIAEQKTSFTYEVLIIDSGSSDKTIEILNDFELRLIQIPNTEFNHGDTRNLAAKEAHGEFLVYLTQDATPANAQWLQNIVDGFDFADNVANVLAKQIPRPDCCPTIKRDIEETFKKIGSGTDIATAYAIEDGKEGWDYYQEHKHTMRFNSDSCAAYRKSALEKVPFQKIDYAEDQVIGEDLLEAGYSRVYYPDAAVIHSHSYPVKDFLKRYYDEYRGLNNAFGYVDGVRLWNMLPAALVGWKNDTQYIVSQKYGFTKTLYWSGHAFLLNCFRRLGGYLGGRHKKLPRWVKGMLSLEKKQKKSAKK
jgi:rhamnosyltransferase